MIDILVLDFNKSDESRRLLESINQHCKFDHRVVFLDNGSDEKYARIFKDEGLIDKLIENPKNEGLGTGTRQLFEEARCEYTIYAQNDQYIWRDFNENELYQIAGYIDQFSYPLGSKIKSVSLAATVCGNGIYSERCHI